MCKEIRKFVNFELSRLGNRDITRFVSGEGKKYRNGARNLMVCGSIPIASLREN